ncbi:MAG: DUF4167 domain-containing protein [Pseudotabrizicola sp.]|uniref:DUF4167 domain-containing protein n=1 Tax=Pseudotabrizicola sp. TaxID=2939647 RepID=UPI00271CC021|nr:DUF4167 domain-containing protein [Pseudotabrizicola sp.]MDO8881758.1 DUF4167 domain-containing protein [Pseudotabrizicola sp.]MDP2082791.1 DUF4167 domain-containing protein [Pseudotabrizicola sp.]MDZ7576236.1 DUF4167 domain-containing protein [Pseudotabrizicola sp.]
MRSSKSRSRSKQNRPRTLGNIINRVFESSGPEGKVRGTPQQIIEKYQLLARDAQLSNDRVAAENFLQHAEHYTRMLSEAQREMAAEQEARQQQFGQNGGQQNGQHSSQQGGQQGNNNNNNTRDGRDARPWRDDRHTDSGQGDQPELGMIDDPRGQDSGLVETPEARPVGDAPRREDRPRRNDRPEGERNRNRDENRNTRGPRPPRPERNVEDRPAEVAPQHAEAPAPQPTPAPQPAPAPVADVAAPAAEPKPRRARAPKKPKDAGEASAAPDDGSPREAAE